MNRLLKQKWEVNSLGAIVAGPARIHIDALDPEDERELARAIASLPALVSAAHKAWAILLAGPADPVAARVRDDLAAILTQIGGRA